MRSGLSKRFSGAAIWLALCCGLAALGSGAFAQGPAALPEAPQATGSASLAGLVKDVGGTPVGDATVTLKGPGGFQRQVESDDDGNFQMQSLPSGAFTLTVSAEGLTTLSVPVVLSAQQQKVLPALLLRIATVASQVDAISQVEMADEQLKVEEKQRIFGIVPNFYVAYDPNTVPLNSKQKFKLAGRTVIDPEVFIAVAISAGIAQGTQTPIEWQQNFTGYMQRYGAGYAGALVGIGLSGAVFPTIFHEDPRYFFKGTGTTGSRLRWSLKQAVEQRNDKGQWRPAYSNMLGDLSASLVTVAIYPHQATDWGKTTALDFGLNIAGEAFGDLMEEFVVPKLAKRKKKTAQTP
jgi:hypothetical protein